MDEYGGREEPGIMMDLIHTTQPVPIEIGSITKLVASNPNGTIVQSSIEQLSWMVIKS